ncbi:MAG: helix-turn-helix transcriptional regulator [Brevibacterium sp.]|uniref:helix-turn-helix transcriptional regulator n=1 Tax=Brevibacterium sp. TaxID=1701 RepID=UPI003F914B0D
MMTPSGGFVLQEPGTYRPIVARSRSIREPIAPIAYDRVKLVLVRHGSAILLSEFGEKPVTIGDVVLLAANTLCGSEPEGSITVTTVYLDRDYVIDQVFWQHAALLTDRWQARDFAEELYSTSAQILRLGADRAGVLMPWLDELVALSLNGPSPARFYRLQALLFSVLDVVTPHITTTMARYGPVQIQRRSTRSRVPRYRHLAPLRTETRTAAALLRDAPAERWTLSGLATAVHLSPSQLGRIFVEAYGKTPMSYLATVRAEQLARLLRDTDLPVEAAMQQVGWYSRGHAARTFRQAVGVTPSRYRQLVRARRGFTA